MITPTTMTITGRRRDASPEQLQLFEYGYWQGSWYARTPAGVANLSAHQWREHVDRTLTVQPSIKVTSQKGTWHGFLERGQWREANNKPLMTFEHVARSAGLATPPGE